MKIQKLNIETLEAIYGINGRIICQPEEASFLGYMLGVLHPGESTRCHRHHEQERFMIVKGEGTFIHSQNKFYVSLGDVIELDPTDDHILINTSNDELIYTSLWWTEASGTLLNPKHKNEIKQLIIISSPPTPNGDLHLGHIAGPYLTADILKRFYRQNQVQSFHLTGSDDYQSYVSLKAQEDKTSEDKIVKRFTKNMQDVFKKYNIETDYFYQPLENEDYQNFVKNFIATLYKKGLIKEKSKESYHCENCKIFLFEATLKCKCPHCKQECFGLVCEECGLFNDGVNIIEPSCRQCSNKPALKQKTQLFFELSKFGKELEKLWFRSKMPSYARALCRKFIEIGLTDIAITHNSTWGLDIPIDGLNKQKVDSWVEMAPAYLFAVSQINRKDHLLACCFGTDNIFYHTVLIPALLIAYDSNTILPTYFTPNFFYELENKKFSKSRNHVVWAKDINISIDAIRYYLAYSRPGYSKTNFSYMELQKLVNTALVQNLSSWLKSLNNKLKTQYQFMLPEAGEWSVEHDQFFAELKHIWQQVNNFYIIDNYSPDKVILLLEKIVDNSLKLAAISNFLDTPNYYNRLEYSTSIVLECTAVKYYALMCYAIMPDFAVKLLDSLGIKDITWQHEIRLLPKHTNIKVFPYFEAI